MVLIISLMAIDFKDFSILLSLLAKGNFKTSVSLKGTLLRQPVDHKAIEPLRISSHDKINRSGETDSHLGSQQYTCDRPSRKMH